MSHRQTLPGPTRPTTRGWDPKRDLPVVFLVLLVNVILVAPTLMRPFDSISPNDEAKYIDSGRSLTRLEVRGLDWGPLVAVVYAPLHMAVGSSPDWFMLEAWGGSILLFIFLWLSIFTLGTRFADHAHPFILAGVLFVSTSFFPTIENQSDALFLGLSALALAWILTFHKSGSLRDLVIASCLAGLAALSRAEAILFLILLPLIAVLLPSRRRRWQRAAAAALPALGLIALYGLASWASTGQSGIEFGQKSWESFEVNQPVGNGGDPVAETHRLFGTGEENGYSVVRAAFGNPEALARRIAHRLADLPDLYWAFFGKRLGVAIAFFAIWGMVSLIRRRDWTLLWISFLWALPTATSLVFLVRHFVPQVSYFPLVVAPVGLAYAVSPEASRPRRLVVVGSLGILTIISLVGDKPAFLFAMGLLLAVTAVVWILRDRIYGSPPLTAVPLLLALGAGLILRGPFDFPDFPRLGRSASEQAIRFLESALPPGSAALAFEPILPMAARMEPIDPPSPSDLPNSPDDLCRWISENSIAAVIVNGQLRANHPELVSLVESILDRGAERAHVSDPATTEVWLITPPCN